MFKLPKLPFAKNALAPHISEETITYHYEKHHQSYVKKLNELTKNTEYEKMSLEEIIKKLSPTSGPIYNNAAQVWNHTFYWNSLSPNGGGEPTGKILELINKKWGSFSEFKSEFDKAASGHFGSGWLWICTDSNGSPKLFAGHDAHNPMSDGFTPILTCDLWEHAFYIDYRNEKAKYVEGFWKVVNWEFANKNLSQI